MHAEQDTRHAPYDGLVRISRCEPERAEQTTLATHRHTGDQLALSLDTTVPHQRAAGQGRSHTPPPVGSRWLRQRLIVILELLAGRRSIINLHGLIAPQLVAQLRASMPERLRHTAFVVRTAHGCMPANDVIEGCATVHFGHRAVAVAARFEPRGDQWHCVRFSVLAGGAGELARRVG